MIVPSVDVTTLRPPAEIIAACALCAAVDALLASGQVDAARVVLGELRGLLGTRREAPEPTPIATGTEDR